mgnify:CR=1 FL=1
MYTRRLRCDLSEDCAVTYFADYLAKKCLDKFKCKVCEKTLITQSSLTNSQELLIMNKSYSNNPPKGTDGLKAPSHSFIKVIDECLNIFETVYEEIHYKYNVKLTLIEMFKSNSLCQIWINDGQCKEHKVFILNHLIICKLFKKGKWHQNKKKIVEYPNLVFLIQRSWFELSLNVKKSGYFKLQFL